jgi:hypothetical protein
MTYPVKYPDKMTNVNAQTCLPVGKVLNEYQMN